MSKIEKLWELPRKQKFLISLICDVLLVFLAYWFAFSVRLGDLWAINNLELWLCSMVIIPCTVFIYFKLNVYQVIVRYLSYRVLLLIFIGSFLSGLTLAGIGFFSNAFIPRTVPIIYSSFLVIFIISIRLIVRALYQSLSGRTKINILIYGAGSAGRQLSIALKHSHEYRAIAFIDRDRSYLKTSVLGLRVLLPEAIDCLITKRDVKKVLLAVPRASTNERKLIIDQLAPYSVEILSVPSFADIVSGKAKISELQDVSVDDLLGRDAVMPQQSLLEANIKNKVVMVTGAGGSIGSELCRQIIKQQPKGLVLFELSEFALYQIDRELAGLKLDVPIYPLLGSVQRVHRLESVMKSFQVDTVYHAAAYKHVPLVEYNVIEGIRNNIYGTYYTAKAAIEAGVESFVLISTDKAVRPTNVMGATKRMAELGLQALAEQENGREGGTRFCMVRFGNVLGSSGSVIPLFKKQIAAGGPLTVTHPDITRYFMTIPEAAQLVIQAGAMGKGGDVFVLDMGESVKITALAENLIKLSGLEVRNDSNPHGDIEIQFSGLRPGEKLYEELLIGDNVEKTAHSRIMTANEIHLPLDEYNQMLDTLDQACHGMKHEDIRELLLSAPTGFKPTDGINDIVWNTYNRSTRTI